MFHDLKIVGNDDIGKVELLLEVFEKIQDLSPDGNIQRRNRLIEDDAFRITESDLAMAMRWRCPPLN